MEISFRTKKLQKLCQTQALATKELGNACAKRLMLRLVQLQAAATLVDVFSVQAARCHPLKQDRKGQFAVDLEHPRRLVFVPDHDPVPLLPDGGVDVAAVAAIQIIEIVDYH